MPAMVDPRFARSLTYIMRHDDDGAAGLVINKPMNLLLTKLLSEVTGTTNIAPLQPPDRPVLYGGPVSPQMGFVLHKESSHWTSTVSTHDGICVTSSRDILEAIAQGQGPDDYLVVLGYAGWSAGQLEQEMGNNAWLNCPADTDLLFHLPFKQRWQASIHKLGIDPVSLVHDAGHA